MNRLTLCVALLSMTFKAMSWCGETSGHVAPQKSTVSFGDIIVQRDTLDGTVLATKYSGAWYNGDAFYGCYYSWKLVWSLPPLGALSGIANTYETTIPGIGLRVSNTSNNDRYLPYSENFGVLTYGGRLGKNGLRMELIKLSKEGTGAGALNYAPAVNIVGSSSSEPASPMGTVSMTANIIPVKCSIETPNIKVPLGDVYMTDFLDVGTTIGERKFDLGLSCDPETKINVTLSANKNTDIARDDIISLSNYGSEGVADGVGVQILYNGSPLANNSTLDLYQTKTSGLISLPFIARYYQTKKIIASGEANATATLNITYQ